MKNYKKIIVSIFALIIFVFLIIFVSRIFMDYKYLSEDEVRQIVLLNSSSEAEEIENYTCYKHLDEKGNLLYRVSYSDSNGVYLYFLQATDGKIIEYSKLTAGSPIPEIFTSSNSSQ